MPKHSMLEFGSRTAGRPICQNSLVSQQVSNKFNLSIKRNNGLRVAVVSKKSFLFLSTFFIQVLRLS